MTARLRLSSEWFQTAPYMGVPRAVLRRLRQTVVLRRSRVRTLAAELGELRPEIEAGVSERLLRVSSFQVAVGWVVTKEGVTFVGGERQPVADWSADFAVLCDLVQGAAERGRKLKLRRGHVYVQC